MSSSSSTVIYSVILIHYVDDYKPRGGDWSSQDDPALFYKRENAEKYLCQALYAWCHEQWAQRGEDEDEEGDDEKALEKAIETYDLKTIEQIAESLSSNAEFVNRKLEWAIKECTVRDSPSPEKKSDEKKSA